MLTCVDFGELGAVRRFCRRLPLSSHFSDLAMLGKSGHVALNRKQEKQCKQAAHDRALNRYISPRTRAIAGSAEVEGHGCLEAGLQRVSSHPDI